MGRVLSVCVLALSAAVPLYAQSVPEPLLIKASGNGLVELPADYAVLAFGVQVTEDRPDSAAAAMSRRIDSVTAALRAIGIPQDSLPTSRLSLRSRPQNIGQERVERYEATSLLRLRVWDLDRVSAILDTALRAGATSIETLDYRSTRVEEGRDEAVRLATEEANRHARLMAEVQGLELVRPVVTTFSAPSVGFDARLRIRGSSTLSQALLNLTPAQIVPIGVSISVQVQVEWEAR